MSSINEICENVKNSPLLTFVSLKSYVSQKYMTYINMY